MPWKKTDDYKKFSFKNDDQLNRVTKNTRTRLARAQAAGIKAQARLEKRRDKK